MKKTLLKMMIPFIGILFMAGCGRYMQPLYEEIQPNQSAYVLPLEGDTKAQGKFDSAEYLEEKKVASKRIYIPQKKVSTGRLWFDYKWIPTARVIKVNREPITFEWEGKDHAKVNAKNISIAVAEKRQALEFAKAAQARTQQVKLEIQRMHAQADLERAKNWKGHLPANMMPENSQFLFNVDTTK